MNIQNLILISISFFMTGASIFIIAVKNPVYSLFFLVLIFFTGSLFLLYIDMEFFALIFLIVYVGAIVVLFLFIIMMLQLKIVNISNNYIQILTSLEFWFGLFFASILSFGLSEHVYDSITLLSLDNVNENIYNFGLFKETLFNFSSIIQITEHIELIGRSLFLDYYYSFLIISFLLFISMVGSIVLTHEAPLFKKVKEQNMAAQTVKNNTFISFKSVLKK
jgi:NADH:ubiquinone oxidoreductase subunit 6 (subunit J)